MQKKTKLIRLIVEREIQSSFLGEIVSSWLVTKMLICSKCLNGKQIWKKSETVHEGITEFRISINILFSSPNSRAFPQKKDKEFRDLCTWEFSLISLFFIISPIQEQNFLWIKGIFVILPKFSLTSFNIAKPHVLIINLGINRGILRASLTC